MPTEGPGLLPRLARGAAVACLVAAASASPSGLAAQEDPIQERIEESQRRLEEIRNERTRLRRQLEQLASQVHGVSEEIRNIERQIGSSASVVAELEVQIGALLDQREVTTRNMLTTRDRLTGRKVVLRERLREIYKRGPLAPFQVLLAARSFSELLNRYKYLHQVALFDRLLVEEVARLERRLEEQRVRLSEELEQVQRLRGQKREEMEDLRRLEEQRQRRLRSYAAQSSQAESRLARLAEDEERLRQLMAELERARREAERRAGEASVSSLRTSDLGQLAWPVEGRIIYNFGPEREDGVTTLREGIGIAAPAGSPVRAVEGGTVQYAGPRNLYGQSIILSHGGGYYSVYLYMQSLAVRAGQEVASGQVIGYVGGSATPEGPHLEFQIYEPGGEAPRAVDPVRWLRRRS